MAASRAVRSAVTFCCTRNTSSPTRFSVCASRCSRVTFSTSNCLTCSANLPSSSLFARWISSSRSRFSS
eukprot:2473870-Pleurochrysis_carterae.AAC.1